MLEAELPASKRARKQTEKGEQSAGQTKLRLPAGIIKNHTKHVQPVYIPPVYVPMTGTKVLPSVALSLFDKATQLILSEDQLVCYGCEGGYRMVRATHGVHVGSYYFEVEVLQGNGEDAHVRLGWSTRDGELQAPVGYDRHSYAYRDSAGAIVHQSVRIDDYGEEFGCGDIIGCYINLSEDAAANRIVFFKNGMDQGPAYSGEEIPFGVYYPAISLYRTAVVRVNFGPTFIIRPELPATYLPISELQPLNPEDRKVHEQHIAQIRKGREEVLAQMVKTEEDQSSTKSMDMGVECS